MTNRAIASSERDLGVSLDYLRHIADSSKSAFFKLGMVMPLANHRKKAPVDAYYLARLAATQQEDCGTCVQIEVNLARKEGLPPEMLRAAVEARLEELPEGLRLAYDFGRAVANGTGEEEELRPRLEELYGPDAVVEIALGIAIARMFPSTKRGLGYLKSCSLVPIDYGD